MVPPSFYETISVIFYYPFLENPTQINQLIYFQNARFNLRECFAFHVISLPDQSKREWKIEIRAIIVQY